MPHERDGKILLRALADAEIRAGGEAEAAGDFDVGLQLRVEKDRVLGTAAPRERGFRFFCVLVITVAALSPSLSFSKGRIPSE